MFESTVHIKCASMAVEYLSRIERDPSQFRFGDSYPSRAGAISTIGKTYWAVISRQGIASPPSPRGVEKEGTKKHDEQCPGRENGYFSSCLFCFLLLDADFSARLSFYVLLRV